METLIIVGLVAAQFYLLHKRLDIFEEEVNRKLARLRPPGPISANITKNWTDGTVLSASDLNQNFDNSTNFVYKKTKNIKKRKGIRMKNVGAKRRQGGK